MSGEWPGAGGEWLRCQLHSHTTNSDGTATPSELVAHYRDAGFDVLAITDHYHVSDHPGDGLLVIASSELTARAGADAEADVLALGAEALPEVHDYFETIEAAAAFVVSHGGVPILAHPYWSGLSAADYLDAPSLCGIEAFNGGCELESGSGTSPQLWDAVLRAGRACVGIATDDCHSPGRDSLVGWTAVKAAERSREAVLDALRAGRFYGSAGPELHGVELADDGIVVSCSSARAVTLRAAPWEGGRINADPARASWRAVAEARDGDGLITRARLRFPERCGWGRIELLAADGRLAWSNPLALPTDPGGPESNWD
jgi:PHP domain